MINREEYQVQLRVRDVPYPAGEVEAVSKEDEVVSLRFREAAAPMGVGISPLPSWVDQYLPAAAAGAGSRFSIDVSAPGKPWLLSISHPETPVRLSFYHAELGEVVSTRATPKLLSLPAPMAIEISKIVTQRVDGQFKSVTTKASVPLSPPFYGDSFTMPTEGSISKSAQIGRMTGNVAYTIGNMLEDMASPNSGYTKNGYSVSLNQQAISSLANKRLADMSYYIVFGKFPPVMGVAQVAAGMATILVTWQ